MTAPGSRPLQLETRLPEQLIFDPVIEDVLSEDFHPVVDSGRQLSLANLAVATYLAGDRLPNRDYSQNHLREFIYSPEWVPGVKSSLTARNPRPLQKFSGIALTHENGKSQLTVSDLTVQVTHRSGVRTIKLAGNRTHESKIEIFTLSSPGEISSAKDRVKELVQRFFDETARPQIRRKNPTFR